jgi:hypothetical protein
VSGSSIRLRRTPAVRVIEDSGSIAVYPEPHTLPVLPKGWAPLGPIEQSALLEACDAKPRACRLRLGSLWDTHSEYRVYCLDGEWASACAATIFDAEYGPSLNGGRNTRLLGVAVTLDRAVRLALDFVNWDLEVEGASWRLAVSPSVNGEPLNTTDHSHRSATTEFTRVARRPGA